MPWVWPFIGTAAASMPARISAGVRPGTTSSIRAATAAALGAADEVPKKTGRPSCELGTRLVDDAGSPGNGGLDVSRVSPARRTTYCRRQGR